MRNFPFISTLISFSICFTLPASAQLQRYETRYYVLNTDLPRAAAAELSVRMDKMAEEYHARTRDFSGQIRARFPFTIYQSREDYLAGGGISGSAGYFNGSALFAFGGRELNDRTWHTLQHEGFHQFAAGVIGGDRPTWLNEGLAEYFGEALFTGDGYISGVIPPWRLKRLREQMQADKLLPLKRMMNLSHDEWNEQLNIINYDQAWSMVHFLAHGDGGKYQAAFAGLMIDLSKGKPPAAAWADRFGSDDGFETSWKAWWLALPANPTSDLYIQATVARLTSFLARATAQNQRFTDYASFQSTARTGKLKTNATDWLPPSLLNTALADADDLNAQGATFTLLSKPQPQLQCMLKNGTRLTGSFQLRGMIVGKVEVRVEKKR